MSDSLNNNYNSSSNPSSSSQPPHHQQQQQQRSTTPPILARSVVNHKLHQRINIDETPQYTALQHAALRFQKDPKLHLKHLLADASRCLALMAVHKSSSSSSTTNNNLNSSSMMSTTSKFDGASSSAATNGDINNSKSIEGNVLTSTTKSMIQRHGSKNSLNGNSSTNNNTNATNGIRRKIILDYSRQHVTGETMELLFDLADRMRLTEHMSEMRTSCRGIGSSGSNSTVGQHQQYALLLRMPRGYYDRSTSTSTGRGGGDMQRFHNPRMAMGTSASGSLDGTRMLLQEVHTCLENISHFSDDVRNGIVRGCTGKA